MLKHTAHEQTVKYEKTAKKIKTVLVISSQVIRGAVGNRVNVHILEKFGCSVWAMPTVIMPWQPRQGESHKMPVPARDFAAFAADIGESPFSAEIDAVITGYFVAPEQASSAAALIKKLKEKRPDCLFLCDPIMGNENGRYVAEPVCRAVEEKLLPLADLVKPNRNELQWICGREFTGNAEIIAAIDARFGGKPFFVSSAFASVAGNVGNMYYNGKEAWLAEHPIAATDLNGFGDIIASLFLLYSLRGASAREIAEKTAAAVYEYLSWTLHCGGDELALASAPFLSVSEKLRNKIKLTRVL